MRIFGRRQLASIFLALGASVAGSWLLTACDPPEPCTVSWVGGSTGNWSDGSNWDGGTTPGSGDRVCTPDTATVTVDTVVAVANAKLKGTVEVPTGSAFAVQAGGPLTEIGHLELTGGTIGGSGIIEVDQLTWTGGTMTGTGRTDVLAGHTTTIASNVRVEGGRELYLRNDVAWTNGTFDLCDGSVIVIWGSMSWDGAGSSIGASGCAAPNVARVAVAGSLDVNANVDASLLLYNFGDFELAAGAKLSTDGFEQIQPATGTASQLGGGSVLEVAGGTGTAIIHGGLLSGTGTIDGDLGGAGIVSPGASYGTGIGTLSVTGSYDAEAGAALSVVIGGTTPGSGHDQLDVGGTATLDGVTLNANVGGIYTPIGGDEAQFVTGSTVSGTFQAAVLPPGDGVSWELTYASTAASLVANEVTVASDHNPSLELRAGTVTATVGSTDTAPTGSVSFDEGGTNLGTDSLDGSGEASASIASLSIGSHQITASYNGDATHGVSTVTYTQVVNADPGGPDVDDDDYDAIEDTDLVVPALFGVLANDTPAPTYTASVVAGSVTNPSHGSVVVAADGGFTYQPDADFSGVDTFTYQANDGGADSVAATVTIHVAGANDAPTAVDLSNDSIDENAPVGTAVGTLTATDPDPADTHTFTLESSGCAGSYPDSSSFTITGDSLKAGASFDFETKDSYSICVRATDDGTPNLSFDQVLTITINDVNDKPVADDESFTGASRAVGNTSLVVNDPTDGAPDPTGPQKTITGDILDGDTDQDGNGSLAVVAGTFATVDGGSVTIEADGDFTFFPKVGASCTDHSDSFDYTLTDQNTTKPPGTALTDTGTVTIEIQDCVWYVDANAAAGDGTSGSPLNSLTGIKGAGGSGDADGAGDAIFLYDGTYAGSLPLEGTQRLYGQRHGLTVPDGGAGTVTLEAAVPAGSPSTVTGGVVLASGNTIQGVDFGNASGPALSGSSVGTAVVNTVTAGKIDNQTGGAVAINGGTVDMAFTSVSSSNSTAGAIALTNVDGTFTGSGGAITNAASADVVISGGNATFTYAGSITDATGVLLSVSGSTGGAKTFSGAITDSGSGTGGGISLTSNTGATIDLTGGVNLSTGANAAFTATGGGTVTVTGSANTITSTNGIGVNIANTTIGAGHVTFRSVNVDGNDSAPTNGIVVNNTGSSGSFKVTGNGSAGTGGTVRDASGAGISLTSTMAPELRWMTVTSNLGNGILGSSVAGATLSDLTVSSNGDDSGAEDGIQFTNLTGSATFTKIDASANARNNALVTNTSGTLNALTVTGSSFHDNQPTGSNGLVLIADGTSTMTVNVNASGGANSFSNNHTVGLLGQTLSAGTLTLNAQGGTFTNNFVGFELGHASSGNLTGTLNGASITNSGTGCSGTSSPCGAPVNLFLSSQASVNSSSILRATVTNNTINNGGSANAPGIWMHTGTPVRGHARLLLTGNNITNVDNRGILVEGGGCAIGQTCDFTIDSTIRANTINLGVTALEGILINAGTNTGDTGTFCADIGGLGQSNSSTSGGADGLRVRHRQSTTVGLPGYVGGQYSTTDVVTYLGNRTAITGDTTTASTSSSGGGFTNLTCQVP